MDVEKIYKFKNSNNEIEEIKLSFYKEKNYYNVINLSEPLADGIGFIGLEDFREKLMEYIYNNYLPEEGYYSDSKRIKYYILLVKKFIEEK